MQILASTSFGNRNSGNSPKICVATNLPGDSGVATRLEVGSQNEVGADWEPGSQMRAGRGQGGEDGDA